MEVKIQIVQTEQPKVFEIKDIEFPIYQFGRGSYKTTTKWRDGDKESEDIYKEIVKIISPTESIQLEKKVNNQTDGDVWVRFEIFKRIEVEPNDCERHYFPKNMQATKEDWDLLQQEFLQYLQSI